MELNAGEVVTLIGKDNTCSIQIYAVGSVKLKSSAS